MLYKLKRIQILKHTIYSVKTLTFLANNLTLAMYIQKKMTNVMTSNQRLSSLCSLIFYQYRVLQTLLTMPAPEDDPAPVGAMKSKYHTQADSPPPIVNI